MAGRLAVRVAVGLALGLAIGLSVVCFPAATGGILTNASGFFAFIVDLNHLIFSNR